MKPIVKRLIMAGGAIALLVVVVIAVIVVRYESMVRAGIERALTYVLEVDVSLESVDIAPVRGRVTLHNLTIANPEGFKTERAFFAETIEAEVDLKSFATDAPVVRRIYMNTPAITLEQGLRHSNLSRLVDSASRLSDGESVAQEAEKAPEGASTGVRIDDVLVERTAVSLSAPALQGRKATVSLPAIHFSGIGGEEGESAIAEGLTRFFLAVLSESAKGLQGDVPEKVTRALNDSVDSASQSVEEFLDKYGVMDERGRDLLKDATERAKNAVDSPELKEGMKKVGEGLKGLLRRNKEED